MIEILLPKYLYREQYRSCIKALEELFLWTEDFFYHEMRALHELLLFHFVEYMAELQQDLPDFNQIYIDEKGHSLMNKQSKLIVMKMVIWNLKITEKSIMTFSYIRIFCLQIQIFY